MQGVASEKIKGGKLLRVRVDYGQKIEKVKITGDFFMHPEDRIDDIEGCLVGFDKNVDRGFIREKIVQVVRDNDVTLIGVDEESIARLVKEAMA